MMFSDVVLIVVVGPIGCFYCFIIRIEVTNCVRVYWFLFDFCCPRIDRIRAPAVENRNLLRIKQENPLHDNWEK